MRRAWASIPLRSGAFHHRNRRVCRDAAQRINRPARPYHSHCCRPVVSDAEMQRTTTLRGVFAPSSAIILPESHSTPIIHRDARTDSIPVGLHSLPVHLDETVLIAVVLKEKMEPRSEEHTSE